MRALAIVAALFVAVWVLLRSTVTNSGDSGTSGWTFFTATPTPNAPNGKFGLTDIENLWTQLGGDPAKAPLAAAIALGESGGDPNAFNPKDPHGGSFGLFQINGVHGDQATFDPIANVLAAISISQNGQNFNPWGAYTNGSYRDFYTGEGN